MAELVAESEVILCVGTGGVGKTSTAAALGVAAARSGRRAVLVTIDPAKRLADAMGISLTHEPRRIESVGPGELWAFMLDPEATFGETIRQHASSPEAAQAILDNRYYGNISGRLAGSADYMASEKLYQLHESGEFDLIIVDTPPSREALAVFEAPTKLAALLDRQRFILGPLLAGGRILNATMRLFLRSLATVVGQDLIDDVIEFLRSFEGMIDGFEDRAQYVVDLLKSERTTFVAVSAPRIETFSETAYLIEQIHEGDRSVGALVINRMHPNLPARPSAELRYLAEAHAGEEVEGALVALADIRAAAEFEHVLADDLATLASADVVVRVPILEQDICDLETLGLLGDELFGR
jgi:anion-transporting  ArsA/GET3 family ATPase